jgi:hypothetical protein
MIRYHVLFVVLTMLRTAALSVYARRQTTNTPARTTTDARSLLSIAGVKQMKQSLDLSKDVQIS